jgi:transposase
MYIAVVPNRNSPPAILLRRGYRENGKAKNQTLANLSGYSPERVEALRRALKGEFDGVLGDVDPISDRTFGVLFVLNQLADRLGITKALGRNTMAKLALFLVLARVAHQGSRLSAVRWAKNHCVAEILGLSDFNKKDLYQALDWMARHQDKIEKKLFRAYAKSKGSPNMLVLYDVTSCYLEGECNEFAAHGFNRDKKKGKKQIVIGLLTGADGEPLAVKVFEGNTSDCTTVSTQIDVIKKRFNIEEVVFVGDRGMIKSKGKQALGENGLKYITALTNPQVNKLLKDGIIQLGLFDQTVCEVCHGNLRLVLRRNDAVRYKEEKRRERKIVKLTQLLDNRNAFVRQSKRADPQSGLRILQNWVMRHKISSFVTLSLDDRQIRLTVDDSAKAQAGLLDGCYVLETDVSQEMLDAKTVDERYRSLQQVERDFRTLKTGFLEIRPLFVRKRDRTSGHAFIAMLALKIVREAENLLQEAFPPNKQGHCPLSLKDALDSLGRLCLNRYKTKEFEFLRLPQLDQSQIQICNALEVCLPSHKSVIMNVDRSSIH